jgi:hypothetical protein
MTTVLVTGGGDRVTEVAAAVRTTGADTVVVDSPDQIEAAVAGRTLDGYVQLPVAMTPRQGSLVARVEQFLSEGLLSRFRSAEVVLPLLAPGATVVLVGGQTNINVDAPDDHEARTALMRVLAHALRAERAPERLKVSTADHTWSAEQIAAQVTRPDPGTASVDETGGRDAVGQAYADWRAEVLGLVRLEF